MGEQCVHLQVTGGQTRVNGLPVDGLKTPRPRTMAVVSLVTTGPVPADKFGPSYGSSPWAGDLAELIVYDQALSALEVREVEDYLLAKYAIGSKVTAPLISPPGGVVDGTQTVSIATLTPGAQVRYTLDGSEPTLLSAEYTEPLQVEATVTVKAKAFREGSAESETATAGFTLRTEAVPLLSGLQLWWRADAGVPSGLGDYWADQSGSGNHGYQVNGAAVARLVPNVVNALPAMRFDGVSVLLN